MYSQTKYSIAKTPTPRSADPIYPDEASADLSVFPPLSTSCSSRLARISSPARLARQPFLTGRSLPLIPDYVFTSPTGNATSVGFFSSGVLGRGDGFVLTLTKPAVYPYVDVLLEFLGMQGSVVVHTNPSDE